MNDSFSSYKKISSIKYIILIDSFFFNRVNHHDSFYKFYCIVLLRVKDRKVHDTVTTFLCEREFLFYDKINPQKGNQDHLYTILYIKRFLAGKIILFQKISKHHNSFLVLGRKNSSRHCLFDAMKCQNRPFIYVFDKNFILHEGYKKHL